MTGGKSASLRRVDLLWGGFWLDQNPAWCGLGDDSVLLADFVRPGAEQSVLDLGTGSGALPLLLLARDSSLRISALELQPELVEIAKHNMALNDVDVPVLSGDMRHADRYFDRPFEYIVTNPPYFPAGAGRSSANSIRELARREQPGLLDDTCAAVAALLTPTGRFALVHRAERAEEIVAIAADKGLQLCRQRFVANTSEDTFHLVLLEFSKHVAVAMQSYAPLFIFESNGVRSAEMQAIRCGRPQNRQP